MGSEPLSKIRHCLWGGSIGGAMCDKPRVRGSTLCTEHGGEARIVGSDTPLRCAICGHIEHVEACSATWSVDLMISGSASTTRETQYCYCPKRGGIVASPQQTTYPRHICVSGEQCKALQQDLDRVEARSRDLLENAFTQERLRGFVAHTLGLLREMVKVLTP